MTLGNRQLASIAALAAVAASVGDLLLLWIAGGGERSWLAAAHYLGVLFIPLYALGYRAVGRMLRSPPIFWIGVYAAAVGAAIHGITTMAIWSSPPLQDAGDRFASLTPILPYLIPLWLFVGTLTFAGSALQFRVVRAMPSMPPWFAWLNPSALIVIVAGLAAPFGSIAEYMIPAAPNLVHVIYFGVVAAIARD